MQTFTVKIKKGNKYWSTSNSICSQINRHTCKVSVLPINNTRHIGAVIKTDADKDCKEKMLKNAKKKMQKTAVVNE